MSKESSRVNAQLVPWFEEKTPYYHLRVHFRGTADFGQEFGCEFWTRIFGSKFGREILGKLLEGSSWIEANSLTSLLGVVILASEPGRFLSFVHPVKIMLFR